MAGLVDADLLVILSDIDALYTADPRRDSTAQRIVEVAQIDQSVYDLAGGSHTRGTCLLYTSRCV